MRTHAMNLSTALLVLAFWVVGGAAAQHAWHIMTAQDASFTVELPQEPRHHTLQGATPEGISYTSHIYSVEVDSDTAYIAATTVYSFPDDVKVIDTRRLLQGGLDAAVARWEGGKPAKID